MFALLLLALASPEPVQTENDRQLTGVRGLSVTIPTEIGSAIKPYIDCLVNADNASIGDGIKADGDVMRSISAKSRETCLPVRTTAAANAAKLLELYPKRTAEERDAMIQSALASAESLSEGIADMMDKYKASEANVAGLSQPNYEQTIEAITRCDIARAAVQIKYVDEFQSDEITITSLGAINEAKLRCIKNAVDPSYILTIADMSQRQAFSDFSERENRPMQKSEALNWLRGRGLLDRLPTLTPGQKVDDFAIAVELACGLKARQVLTVSEDSWISIQQDALSVASFEKSAQDLECLMNMYAASDARENGVRFVFMGNAVMLEVAQEN